jgi:hypothetical protein
MLKREGGMFFKDLPDGCYFFYHLSHVVMEKTGQYEAVEAGTPQTITYPQKSDERVIPLSIVWDCGKPVGITIGHQTVPIPNEQGPVIESTGDGR